MTDNPRLSRGGGLRKLAALTWRGERRIFRIFPSEKRCKVCYVPFQGPFSLPFWIIQIRPARKNPNMCTSCYELAPLGQVEVDLSVVFVDVRGYTSLSERLDPIELVERLNRFYKLAGQVIFDLDGTLDKMVGDEVMAFFGAPFRAQDHPQRAVRAAFDIVAGMEEMANDSNALRVGGGVGTGQVLMGNVGEGEVRDFTVIGDVVNTTARLQGEAGPGEVVMSEHTYGFVADRYPDAPRRTLELTGKAQPEVVRMLQVTSPGESKQT